MKKAGKNTFAQLKLNPQLQSIIYPPEIKTRWKSRAKSHVLPTDPLFTPELALKKIIQ